MGIIEAYTRILKKEVSMLEEITNFLQEEKLNELKNIIEELKKKMEWRWSDNNTIRNAVRDSILLGKINVVTLFLDEGINANSHAACINNSSHAMSLVYFAASSNNLPILQLLIERGATVSSENNGIK